MGQSQSILPDIQSEPIPNYKPVAGEGVPRRRVGVTSLPRCGAFGPECDNLYALFRRAAERHPARPCIGRRVAQPDGARPFEFIDFETTHKSALIAGSGLKNLGLGRGDQCPVDAESQAVRGGRVDVFAQNTGDFRYGPGHDAHGIQTLRQRPDAVAA